jgi:hypothetical protein
LLVILNCSFPKNNITTISVTEETKKRQKTNANGSMVLSPILIMGKDVPHKTPANMVKKTAFPFLLNSGLGNGSSPCHSNTQATPIKHFCSVYQGKRGSCSDIH